jgi:hypothetical protein
MPVLSDLWRLRKKSICCVALHPSSLQRTPKVRLIPQDLRALPLELFTKPPQIDGFTDFLRERHFYPMVNALIHYK